MERELSRVVKTFYEGSETCMKIRVKGRRMDPSEGKIEAKMSYVTMVI